MRNLFWVFQIFLITSFSTVQAQTNIDNCGILYSGVEGGCIIFHCETGVRYLVNDVSPYGSGDTVRITGLYIPSLSFCMQGKALRYVEMVSYCDNSDCCGLYTAGATGNINCDDGGNMNLSDITRLIDAVYISNEALCCEGNGNIDGDVEARINLADITRLIDHVYISKAETAACE